MYKKKKETRTLSFEGALENMIPHKQHYLPLPFSEE